MARKRFIDPSFWQDDAVKDLTYVERLFFIGCFSNADDDGRLPGNPAFLRSTIFPYDDLTLADVKAMRDRVAAICKNYYVYSINGNDYIAFRRWRDYQSPRYPQPSKIPAPPWEQERNSPDNATDDMTYAPLTQDCNYKDATLPQDCVNDVTMGSGRDQVGDQDQVRDQVGDGDANPPPVPDEILPDATLEERLTLHELSKVPRWPPDMPRNLEFIRTIAIDFPTIVTSTEAKAWRIYKMDKPLLKNSNPRSQFRNWCEISAKKQLERGERSGRGGAVESNTRKTGKYDDLAIR